MKKFIKFFTNKNEKNLNTKLIKREYEEDLIEFIVQIYKSLEVTGFVTFMGYEVITDENKIDFSKYITTRKKKKKKEKNLKYHYMHPDRADELVLKFKLHVKGEECIISKSILVPKKDINNYFTLRDKRYFLLYQLVDNSTYTSKNGLTLKSLMPICVNKDMIDITDTEGTVYNVPYYYINVFKREIDAFLFYFSKMGFAKALTFFSLDKIIEVMEERPEKNDKTYVYFPINKHLTLRVVNHFFKNYLYIQSMTAMIMKVCNTKTNAENLESTYYWTQRLGSLYTNVSYKLFDSGNSTVSFFERLLDITTQSKLKVSDINKYNVYAIVRWMIQNYLALKKKDNLNINNKRLRLYEYIAALLSKKVGEGINRILILGNRIKLEQVKNIFKFPGTIIFQILYTSPLLKYDDRVNIGSLIRVIL